MLNHLYKHTPMQTNFAVNMLALVDGVPRTLNLRERAAGLRRPPGRGHHPALASSASTKAQDRAHIVEGLLKALDMIDAIIALIRGSATTAPRPATALMAKPFEFSEIQANHILDMPLRRLAAARAARSCATSSTELRDDDRRARVDPRRRRRSCAASSRTSSPRSARSTPTSAAREITLDPGDLDDARPHRGRRARRRAVAKGYVKTVAADAFRTQGRGGRGVRGGNLRDEDYVAHLLTTTAHSYLLFFSNRGRVYRLRAHEIPMKERTARGTALVNLIALAARRAHRGDHRHAHLRGRRVPVLRDQARAW